MVPITGGTFEGPRLKGKVLPGADWQIVRPDGVLELEARYALETDDGALISMVNRCLRRASPEVMARLKPLKDDPAALRAEGIAIATELCDILLEGGAPGLHFYTLNRSKATREIYAALSINA